MFGTDLFLFCDPVLERVTLNSCNICQSDRSPNPKPFLLCAHFKPEFNLENMKDVYNPLCASNFSC